MNRLYIYLIILVFFSSCIKESGYSIQQNELSRTILVYLAGDNNESESIEAVIEKIRKGWKYTGCNCIIYHDAINAPPKLLRIRGGCCKNPTPYIEQIAVYPEENSASANVFNRVIKEVVAKFPADSYGLIFSSHATGWLPHKLDNSQFISIGEDNNNLGETPVIELLDFANAIPDKLFDFIIFETCLMAGIEVAYELKDKTKYILSSSAELLSPGFVPIYERSIGHLTNKNLHIENALQYFGEDYMKYINNQNGAWKSATLSLIKTSQLDSLAKISKEIFLNKEKNKFFPTSGLQHFDRPIIYGNRNKPSRFFDFEQYLHLMGLKWQNRKLSEQLSKTVTWKASTNNFLLPGNYNGFEIKQHSGITSFIETEATPELNNIYRELSWYQRVILK